MITPDWLDIHSDGWIWDGSFGEGMTAPIDLSIVPKYTSTLVLTEELAFHFVHPRPNRWWRFWQRVFFGFEWKEYDDYD